MNIGEKIYNLRTKAGISQETMGLDLGVSRQAVSKWETNQSTPDIENIKMIANYFNVPLTDLIDEKVDKLIIKPEETKAMNKLNNSSKTLLIIASSLSILLFLGSMLIILLQKPLSSLFKLTVHGEHIFVFPILEFIGTLILVTFIIIISLNVILKKHLAKNISFEIVSIVVCALCINTFLTLPGLATTLLKNSLNNMDYALSYSSVKYLLQQVQSPMIITSIVFITGISLSLAAKTVKYK